MRLGIYRLAVPSMLDALGSIPRNRVCVPLQRVHGSETENEAANLSPIMLKPVGFTGLLFKKKKERGRISTVERFGNQHR